MAFFSVFWMVLKRVWNNRRLEANLLLALIVALSVIASVPIYTDGALQYVLVKQWHQSGSNQANWAPGSMMMWHTSQTRLPRDKYVSLAVLEQEAERKIAMPLIRHQRYATVDNPLPKGTAEGTK